MDSKTKSKKRVEDDVRDSARAAADRAQTLPDQKRDFRDSDGSMWHAQIRQDGGRASVGDHAPARVIVFSTAPDHPDHNELVSAPGDQGSWDLASYDVSHLRELLAQAKAHANGPSSD
jgi:hypothetical protein